MSEHQHIALFQIRFNVVLIHISLQLIVNQDHNNICLFCSLCRSVNLEALIFCFCPGFASFIKTDNDIASGFL